MKLEKNDNEHTTLKRKPDDFFVEDFAHFKDEDDKRMHDQFIDEKCGCKDDAVRVKVVLPSQKRAPKMPSR